MEIDSPENCLHAGLFPLVETELFLKTVKLFRTPILCLVHASRSVLLGLRWTSWRGMLVFR